MKKVIKIIATTLMLVLCVFTFAGCGKIKVYGNTFTYQGRVNISYSSLDSSYGTGLEAVISNLMDKIDWTDCYLENEKIDLSSKNFKNSNEVINYFTEEYKKLVQSSVDGLELTFGSEEDKKLTVSKGDESFEYNLKSESDFGEGFLDAYLVKEDGTEYENKALSLRESTDANELYLIDAEFPAVVKIGLKSPIKDYDGDDTSYIEINYGVLYSLKK